MAWWHITIYRIIIERAWWLILLVFLGAAAFFASWIPQLEINAETDAFMAAAGGLAERLTPCRSIAELVAAVRAPRPVIIEHSIDLVHVEVAEQG